VRAALASDGTALSDELDRIGMRNDGGCALTLYVWPKPVALAGLCGQYEHRPTLPSASHYASYSLFEYSLTLGMDGKVRRFASPTTT
jgi:hypothetical protein